jgi:hypothetical protein
MWKKFRVWEEELFGGMLKVVESHVKSSPSGDILCHLHFHGGASGKMVGNLLPHLLPGW